MGKLILKRKMGFIATRPFKIFDERKKLFYSNNFSSAMSRTGKVMFNLPIGIYTVRGEIHSLPEPIKQKKINLPKPERHFPKFPFKIIYRKNSNKCTVFWKKKIIVFDPYFKTVPKYKLMDIYFHELGHRLYKTEHLADLYSTKRMLDVGFNPSQIGRSIMETLSNNNFSRKSYKINSML